MKPEFTVTEFGVLPHEWNVSQLSALVPFATSGSRGWARYYAERGAAFIRITNLSRESIYLDLSDLKRVNLPPENSEGRRTSLREGDLLISITADIGIIGYVDAKVPQPAYINQHIALVRFEPTVADTKFLAYFLASNGPQKTFRATTDSGAKAGMNLARVRQIQAAFPPLPEQRAIAEALSDVDALLGALDRLIAKKRDLKQAAMQQLLAGQTRLPGFSGEWEVKAIGRIAPLQRGFDLPGAQLRPGQFPVVYSNGIMNYHNVAIVRGPGVVTGRSGTIGRVSYVQDDFWPHNTALWVKNFNGNDPKFIYYLYQHVDLGRFESGSGVPTLNRNDVHSEHVSLPSSVVEQSAIATVLSDMDAELEALEQRRAKTAALKQGMMQELLTGRTRLV